MTSVRQNKVARLIQKELADILQKDHRTSFGPFLISVTYVFMSPDMSFAKTYVSIFGAGDKGKPLEALRALVPEIRRSLGKRLGKNLRIIPEIAFFPDESADHAKKMDALFDQINKEYKDPE